jgi:glutamate synthase domain-containing protein 3
VRGLLDSCNKAIYDLKMVSPRAKVGVKLVAEEGVGTIAAGVAKGYAVVKRFYPIRNIPRTVGARLAGEIARRFGERGLPDGTIELHFEGSAG